MAYDWSPYTWRLIFRDDFTTYADQAAYEAAYPTTIFGAAVSPYGVFGLTNGPNGEPGLRGALTTRRGGYVGTRPLNPERRAFKFIVRMDNDWAGSGGILAGTVFQVFSFTGPSSAQSFIETNVFSGHPSFDDDDFIATYRPGTTGTALLLADGVLPHGSASRDVEVRTLYSTLTETSPGVFAANADGAIDIFIDGVVVASYEGAVWNGRSAIGVPPYWDGIVYSALGRMSLCEAYDTVVPADSGGDESIISCCRKKKAKKRSGGGDIGTNADPTGILPPWEASCIGGGLTESVLDLADGESWL